jgi:hypothetical protein
VYSDEGSYRSGDSRSSGHVEPVHKPEEEKVNEEEDPGEDRCRTMIVEIWVMAEKEEKANASLKPAPKSPKHEVPELVPVKEEPDSAPETKEEEKEEKPVPEATKADKTAASESAGDENKPTPEATEADAPAASAVNNESKDGKEAEESKDEDEGKKEEPEPAPKKEMTLNERRIAITAILKDDSLTGPEKQERIKGLRPPPRARRTAPMEQPGAVESAAAIRRKAIQAVHADKTLTPKEKHGKIQELIKGNN